MQSSHRDTDLALPPIPGSDSGIRQRPERGDTVESPKLPAAKAVARLKLVSRPPAASLPPPRASLPSMAAKKSSWVDDGATVPDDRGKKAIAPPKAPLRASLPPRAKPTAKKKPAPPMPRRSAPPPTPKAKLPPAPKRSSLPPPTPAATKPKSPPPTPARASLPPPPPAEARRSVPPPTPSLPPPPPRATLKKAMKALGNTIETLVGLELIDSGDKDPSLLDLPPLGPNPFGPATAEFDLKPYLRKTPFEAPPRAVIAGVVATFFVLGCGLAVAAMGDDAAAGALKYAAKPPAFDHEPAPPPIPQPRLTELMDQAPPPAPTRRRAIPEPPPEPAPAVERMTRRQRRLAERRARIEEIRERRQARRRARIRARWLANH